MSIMYCEKHDRRWDSDNLDECPDCEHEPNCPLCGASQDTAGYCPPEIHCPVRQDKCQ